MTALCLVNTTLAFLFVLFASIFPRLKSRVALSRGKKTAQNVVGKKRGEPIPVLVILPASRCIGTSDVIRPCSRRVAHSYGFNFLSQPLGFMGPPVITPHTQRHLTPRVYSCAYIQSPSSSPFIFATVLRSADARSV